MARLGCWANTWQGKVVGPTHGKIRLLGQHMAWLSCWGNTWQGQVVGATQSKVRLLGQHMARLGCWVNTWQGQVVGATHGKARLLGQHMARLSCWGNTRQTLCLGKHIADLSGWHVTNEVLIPRAVWVSRRLTVVAGAGPVGASTAALWPVQGLQWVGGVSAGAGSNPSWQGASGDGLQWLQHCATRPQHCWHAGVCGGMTRCNHSWKQ